MQVSNLPFSHWFIAIHLLTGTKKTFSALELQRQIGLIFYEPKWSMMQKLRITMESRDCKYPFDKIVELDEGSFKSVDTEKDEDKKICCIKAWSRQSETNHGNGNGNGFNCTCLW